MTKNSLSIRGFKRLQIPSALADLMHAHLKNTIRFLNRPSGFKEGLISILTSEDLIIQLGDPAIILMLQNSP